MSTPEQLALAARECVALTSARRLAEWVGAGQAVTTRGVLKPAAAVEACDVLGIEPPSRKPRSALDIEELMMVWGLAVAAGFIEVSRDRVTAGPALRPWLEGDPEVVLSVWTSAVLLILGMDEMTEDGLEYVAVLATLDDRGGTAALSDVEVAVARFFGAEPVSCSCPDCTAESELDEQAEVRQTVENLGDFGIAVVRGDAADLTPLGQWLTDFLFRKSAPPATVDAKVLLSELGEIPAMVATLMARSWLSAREPAVAVRELLAAAESAPGRERLAALTMARECGTAAAPAWREWATNDGLGAYARAWLAEQEGTEAADADWVWITVDTLVTMLDALPPELQEEVLPGLVQGQIDIDLVSFQSQLDSCGHPDAARLSRLLNPAADPAGAGYEIKVQLRGATKPPVWRRLQVPAELTLDRVHQVIQTAMGWEDCHLHVFTAGRREYGVRDPELGHLDERKARLSQLLPKVGAKIQYTYDFGDCWEHDITLEAILPAATGPVCVAGKGACPPEDCGGVWGYQELKATLADPGAGGHADMLDWLGLDSADQFDPTEFSVEEVNEDLG